MHKSPLIPLSAIRLPAPSIDGFQARPNGPRHAVDAQLVCVCLLIGLYITGF